MKETNAAGGHRAHGTNARARLQEGSDEGFISSHATQDKTRERVELSVTSARAPASKKPSRPWANHSTHAPPCRNPARCKTATQLQLPSAAVQPDHTKANVSD